ncbi:GNAT family N-acetyltransferase [Streptomyces sp. NBC_00078]|uniref:GNAT family N-acetyltransferase n=1 Tax=unclassified Streptomyces TaxID=2593676 RepID=UPI0022509F08|nr:GNAT family N-acetyltransferase [Streptomyces sp. NBC_00078]MCX5423579.1 GNAT family N-acetyltransferase [Streptomyces sp. NBC_00078]
MDEVVRAWVHGWVLSRRAAPPMAEPWGWTVDVGLVDQVSRHVFGATNDDVDENTVRKVAGSVSGAGVWLKVFQDPSVAREWVGAGWWVDPEPGHLMTIPLTGAEETEVPYGHRLRCWTRGGVTTVLVAAPDGSLAARGQIAANGATAVADRIETAPAHRRRGLGSVVMRTLQRAAAEQGAETGVLAGTPAGRALYEALGWRAVAPLTSARFVGPAGRP